MVAPAAVLALVLNHEFSVMEVLWTFSIYLESVAILPQLFMVSKTGEAESITSHYLFALGMYRALYILNWVYRYYFEGREESTTGTVTVKIFAVLLKFNTIEESNLGRSRALY